MLLNSHFIQFIALAFYSFYFIAFYLIVHTHRKIHRKAWTTLLLHWQQISYFCQASAIVANETEEQLKRLNKLHRKKADMSNVSLYSDSIFLLHTKHYTLLFYVYAHVAAMWTGSAGRSNAWTNCTTPRLSTRTSIWYWVLCVTTAFLPWPSNFASGTFPLSHQVFIVLPHCNCRLGYIPPNFDTCLKNCSSSEYNCSWYGYLKVALLVRQLCLFLFLLS